MVQQWRLLLFLLCCVVPSYSEYTNPGISSVDYAEKFGLDAEVDEPLPNVFSLPRHVKPVEYSISITPNLTSFTFSGEETIKVQQFLALPSMQSDSAKLFIRKRTSVIRLHAADLNVTRATFRCSANCPHPGTFDAQQIRYDLGLRTVALTFDYGVVTPEAQDPVLYLQFSGTIRDNMVGLYRSNYTTPNGTALGVLVASQSQPLDARRVFPCWDEPAFKAKFQLSILEVPSPLIALSNMPPVRIEQLRNGNRNFFFDVTPEMSTYLVAIVIGDLDWVESTAVPNITLRVYVPRGRQPELGRFALRVAEHCLNFFSEYFAIPYPLPKLDLMAIPDFAAGAMENWGLITFREWFVLVDEHGEYGPKTSISTKQHAAYVVAHEIAHQWFGNLVTMETWDELWLNEGFATFAGYLAVDHAFPSWGIWTSQFYVKVQAPGLQLDSLSATHPVHVPLTNPDDIVQIFDEISYNKGACIIRMLADTALATIGPHVFQYGLRAYLSERRYGNANAADLWWALMRASGLDVAALMDSWILQPGYPLVSVGVESIQTDTLTLRFTQERFTFEESSTATRSQIWAVPIAVDVYYTDGVSTTHYVLLNQESTTLEVPLGGALQRGLGISLVKVNPGQMGFYRTRYDQSLLGALAVQLATLPASERQGHAADMFALAMKGAIGTVDYLTFLRSAFLRGEREYTVWAEIAESLKMVMQVWSNDTLFSIYVSRLFDDVATAVGLWSAVENEPEQVAMLRGVILDMLVRCRNPKVETEAYQKFLQLVQGQDVLPPDLRVIVLRSAMAQGGIREWQQILDIYRRSKSQELRISCIVALGRAPTPELIQRTLDFAISAEVKPQDTFFVFNSIAQNPAGRAVAWQFVQDHWALLAERYEGTPTLLGRIAQAVLENTRSHELLAAKAQFFTDIDSRGIVAAKINRVVAQAIERARISIAWYERDAVAVNEFLVKQ